MIFQRGKIKGVIFDLDETLISSLENYTEAFNRGLAAFGLEPVTQEKIAGFLDRGFRLGKMLLELFPSAFQNEENLQAGVDEIRKAYVTSEAEKVSLKPGADRILQSLKEGGLKIGIVTGRTSQGDSKWRELHRLNINQFIDVMVTGTEATPKPAPDGLIKCIRELGLTPEDCVFIGDSSVDIIAGKRAGVRTVAIHGGVATRKLLAEQQPDYILADLSLLLSCLSEM